MFNGTNDVINDLIAKDVIKLIDRIELVMCKKYLKELNIKGYSKLKAEEIRKFLVDELKKQNIEYILKIYNENKIRLDMFKYEVCDTLELSNYKFNKKKNNFTISGIQSIRAGGKTQKCNKYCRIEIYKAKLEV